MSAIRFYAPAFCVAVERGSCSCTQVPISFGSRLLKRAGRWHGLQVMLWRCLRKRSSRSRDEGIQIGAWPMGQQVGAI